MDGSAWKRAYLPLSNGDGPGGSSIYANWQLIYDALIDPLRLQDATFYQPHDLDWHRDRIGACACHCLCAFHAGFYRHWPVRCKVLALSPIMGSQPSTGRFHLEGSSKPQGKTKIGSICKRRSIMKVIIIGCGRVGAGLAKALSLSLIHISEPTRPY